MKYFSALRGGFQHLKGKRYGYEIVTKDLTDNVGIGRIETRKTLDLSLSDLILDCLILILDYLF